MIFNNVLLPTLLIPIGAALVALISLTAVEGKRALRVGELSPLGGAAAFGGSLLAASVAMTGWPRWLPTEATQRLFFLVIVGVVLSFIAKRSGALVLWSLIAVATVSVLPLLLESQIEHRWSTTQALIWIGALGLLGLAIAWSFVLATKPTERRFSTPGGRLDPLWAAALRPTVLGGCALCLGLSGSALLGQLMGALAAAAATIEVWQWMSRRRIWAPSDALVWATAVGGLLLIGFFYSDLAPAPALLLLASLLLLAGHRSGAPASFRLACLLPLAIAAGLVTAAELNQEPDPYDYGRHRTETALPSTRLV